MGTLAHVQSHKAVKRARQKAKVHLTPRQKVVFFLHQYSLHPGLETCHFGGTEDDVIHLPIVSEWVNTTSE